MKYIINFVPHTGSGNLGDYIIVDSTIKILNKIFYGENIYFFNIATHQPLTSYHRKLIKLLIKNKVKMVKIVSGTNLFNLFYTPFSNLNSWKVNYLDIPYLKGIILFGVGTQIKEGKAKNSLKSFLEKVRTEYSKWFWRKILNPDFPHMVRDQESVDLLRGLGLEGKNLGCPTLWFLTKEHCKEIPSKKSDAVITTLTAYNADFKRDLKMFKILFEYYKKVYIWPQGIRDFLYLNKILKVIKYTPSVIPPRLEDYDRFLLSSKVDYVGTRLHAGIRALQHKKRTIVVSIDNRAKSFSRDFKIHSIERENIEKLPDLINSEFETKISIPEKEIKDYLVRFKKLID